MTTSLIIQQLRLGFRLLTESRFVDAYYHFTQNIETIQCCSPANLFIKLKPFLTIFFPEDGIIYLIVKYGAWDISFLQTFDTDNSIFIGLNGSVQNLYSEDILKLGDVKLKKFLFEFLTIGIASSFVLIGKFDDSNEFILILLKHCKDYQKKNLWHTYSYIVYALTNKLYNSGHATKIIIHPSLLNFVRNKVLLNQYCVYYALGCCYRDEFVTSKEILRRIDDTDDDYIYLYYKVVHLFTSIGLNTPMNKTREITELKTIVACYLDFRNKRNEKLDYNTFAHCQELVKLLEMNNNNSNHISIAKLHCSIPWLKVI